MANKKQTTRTSIDELNETLTSVEQRVENNKKIITWSVAGIVIVAAIILLYFYGISAPKHQDSVDKISKADIEMALGNDSVALAQYKLVADEFSNEAGSRAALETAIALYKDGKNEEALQYLKKADFSDAIVAAAAKSLEGDCLVNLGKLDEALSSFEGAVSASDDNALYTPLFLLKKANIYTEQGKAEKALDIYETIKADYAKFANAYGLDIDMYIARAKAQAETK